jgi:hypothetical protein
LSLRIPSFTLSVVAVILQLQNNASGMIEVLNASNICFVVGLGLLGAAILI